MATEFVDLSIKVAPEASGSAAAGDWRIVNRSTTMDLIKKGIPQEQISGYLFDLGNPPKNEHFMDWDPPKLWILVDCMLFLWNLEQEINSASSRHCYFDQQNLGRDWKRGYSLNQWSEGFDMVYTTSSWLMCLCKSNLGVEQQTVFGNSPTNMMILINSN